MRLDTALLWIAILTISGTIAYVLGGIILRHI